ncbi:hypothetical protein [Borreliella burgdorferi]|uniref:hypothetical protein n=1 Tax=Borreliella burgdorferi TaxID=139 RepID=UPI001E608542|nr:hypothetical protein [Borreliella burgdorferi]MCD2308878.1 hypothetical protein [Borreliella burgdorferi]MCD2318085.1 hypothetical protein [Borreliella burgdorferi]MCD2380587.1 hypothetical protein [Borreliella burgdorferi]
MYDLPLIDNLPVIKRARFFYLYDIHGKRYLDLYLNGGRNFLGYRVQGLNRLFKQTMSRGLISPYPSVFKNQFINLVFTFFKEAGSVYIFKLEKDAKKFLLSLTGKNKFFMPWEKEEGIYEFRVGFSNIKYPMIFNIPLPNFMSVSIVVMDNLSRKIEFKDNFDAVTLSLARHTLSKLLFYKKNIDIDFNSFATPLFRIADRYMLPLYDACYHAEIFNEFLKFGYLISPNFSIPSIVPLKFSKGDLDNFKKLCFALKNKFIDGLDSDPYK